MGVPSDPGSETQGAQMPRTLDSGACSCPPTPPKQPPTSEPQSPAPLLLPSTSLLHPLHPLPRPSAQGCPRGWSPHTTVHTPRPLLSPAEPDTPAVGMGGQGAEPLPETMV